MRRTCPTWILAVLAGLLPTPGTAQEPWTDQELTEFCTGFLEDATRVRLEQTARLLAHMDAAYPAMCARIHGDHREYLLKIDRLLDELSAPRWEVREEAERTLVEIGARARELIQRRTREYEVLEEAVRAQRILQLIDERGTEKEKQEKAILRGLVSTALYVEADDRLREALRSALGHTDTSLVDGALRAIGAHGRGDDARVIANMIDWKGGIHRRAALGALPRVRGEKALALCSELLRGGELTQAEAVAMIRSLREREDGRALLASLPELGDPVVQAAVDLPWSAEAGGGAPHEVVLTLSSKSPTGAGRGRLTGGFLGFVGDAVEVADPLEGLPRAEIPFSESDVFDFPGREPEPAEGIRLFLNQGSLVIGELITLDPEALRLRSAVFGDLTVPRGEIQGIALDPGLDRLIGSSPDHDRLRLANDEFVDGALLRFRDGTFEIETPEGVESVPQAEVAGVLLKRPPVLEFSDATYTRIDLTTGERILGHFAGLTPRRAGIVAPLVGGAVVPVDRIVHVEHGVGGGALWGFTLIADYSENRLLEIDDQGRETFVLEEVYGAWDVECLDNSNLLLTEFSVSRVQELDRHQKVVWVYEDLRNPYDADRLPNGNTLIADTFGSRVIEVTPDKEVVWKYDQGIRPFDVERLPNGNTLIADVMKDRVIEVSPEGEILWEAVDLPDCHDADRLPNGNTLIALRTENKVVEIDRNGKVVFEIENLSSPSDADRLPNGHTLVAENGHVREFDRNGNEVWRKEDGVTWAVEVNRY